MGFKRLKYGPVSSFKNSEKLKFKPSEGLSKYLEIGVEDLLEDGSLPLVEFVAGAGVVKRLYSTTFALAFHPALKLGTHFLERVINDGAGGEGTGPHLLFYPEFEGIKVDLKREKVTKLPYICRVYELDNAVN